MARTVIAMVCLALRVSAGTQAYPCSAAGEHRDKSAASRGSYTYFINAEKGEDTNSGFSRRHAWRSIDRINRTVFGPGDRILFTAGQTFKGTLRFKVNQGSDTTKSVLVSSAGSGRAVIDAGASDGCVLTDCSRITVRVLNFVGCGRKNGSDGIGIHLTRTHNVLLRDIDVTGFRLGGIVTGGDENTRIQRVSTHDNGAAGIMTDSGYGDVPRSRNLLITDCIADNNPGDPKNLDNHSGNGIVVGGVDGALIEYCEASNNGWDMPRDGNGPVGIWGWNSDRLVIQHCISHDNKSPGADGGGFDFDGGVTNSTLQYNLSYNNMGCGYLLCQYPGARPWRHNTVRYNISINDGLKNFHSGIGLWLGDTGISDGFIYNNTIINPTHAVSTLGDLPGMVYRNNLFLVGEDLLIGDLSHSRFENNLYWSTGNGALYRNGETVYASLPEWARATSQEKVDGELVGRCADPELLLPTAGQKLPTDPRKFARMRFCRLRPHSPAIHAGMRIPDPGECDLFGNPLPSHQKPSIGAHEAAQIPVSRAE